MSRLAVMKFGGTSVEDAAAINRVVDIVFKRRNKNPVLVISAMARVTDSLLDLARKVALCRFDRAASIIAKLRARHLILAKLYGVERGIEKLFSELENVALTSCNQDSIVSFGERLSSLLVTAALQARGVSAELTDARRFIITDNNFGNAAPIMHEIETHARATLLPIVNAGRIPVTQGFIGSTVDGTTTTLGRGGSDYSASIIGAALKVEVIEIWTDVDGIMTADPRVVPEARRIREISFDEAAELSYFGAKVLHPNTVMPAVEQGIPIHVFNSRNPSCDGTVIKAGAISSDSPVKSIAFKRGFDRDKAMVCILGENLKSTPGMIARLLRAIGNIDISLTGKHGSEKSLIFVVDEDRINDVVCSLHREFISP
jgi:aspartate kinase